MMERFPVVISGAGPVGLSLALALSLQGVDSLVLEQKERLSEHSKAPGVLPRTLEIFRAWGIVDAFLQEGTFLNHPRIWLAGELEPRFEFDLSVLEPITPYPGVLILPQNRTEHLLLDRVRQLGRTEVRFGHRLDNFRNEVERVAVHVESRGRRYQVRADYLVGCDGPHSEVRQRLNWDLEGDTYRIQVRLLDVSLPDSRDELPWPRATLHGSQPRVALRIGPRLWRIIAPLGQEAEPSQSMVDELWGPGPFEEVWSSDFRIHCRTSPSFRRGRVVLAGDAAHLNSPAGGQGMNGGIQDAHNLAWKLAACLEGANPGRLLNSYDRERRAVVKSSIDPFTNFLTRAVLFAPNWLRALSARLATWALRSDWLRLRVALRLGMLSHEYPEGGLIGPGGGARAPNVELSGGVRLHDLAQKRPALLLIGGAEAPPTAPPCPVYRIDWEPNRGELWDLRRGLRQQLGAGAQIALLRPDGHLAFHVPTGTALAALLSRCLGSGFFLDSSRQRLRMAQ